MFVFAQIAKLQDYAAKEQNFRMNQLIGYFSYTLSTENFPYRKDPRLFVALGGNCASSSCAILNS